MPQAAESSAVTRSIREGEGDGGAAPGVMEGGVEAAARQCAADRARQVPGSASAA